MIPYLFHDQLVVLGLLGLVVIVYYAWSSGWVTGGQRPTTPVIRKNRISTFFSMICGPGRRQTLSRSISKIALDTGALSHDNRRR
jgi:hypothetical protein